MARSYIDETISREYSKVCHLENCSVGRRNDG